MSEPIVDLPELDEPPKNDYWAPEVSEVEATPAEIAEGNSWEEVLDDDIHLPGRSLSEG